MNAPVRTPLISIAVVPKTPDDRKKLERGLVWLMSEDPAIGVKSDPASGEFVVFCAGEQHLEVVVDRLKREFGVAAMVGRPQVAYRETVTVEADGEMKYARRVDGRGQYGHVKLTVHPGAPGSGIVFENAILHGTIPQAFINPIEDAIRERLSRGIAAGHPIDDVRVVIYDGSYHDVDSSEHAFRIAAALALEQALKRARPVLLQPMMRVEVNAPREHLAAIVGDLTGRSARIQSGEEREGIVVVTARAPLAELFGYATALRAGTFGRGAYTMRFDGYEPFEPPDEAGGDRDSLVRAPLAHPPTGNVSSITLPEPHEPLDNDPDAQGRSARR